MRKILILGLLYSISFASFKEISYKEAIKDYKNATWLFHYNKCETSVEYVSEVFTDKKLKNKKAVETLFENLYNEGKSYKSKTQFFKDKNKLKVVSNGHERYFFKNEKDCKKLLQPIKATLML